jgi:hypothetical protein
MTIATNMNEGVVAITGNATNNDNGAIVYVYYASVLSPNTWNLLGSCFIDDGTDPFGGTGVPAFALTAELPAGAYN